MNTSYLPMEGNYRIRLTKEDMDDLQDLSSFFLKETKEGDRNARMLEVISEMAFSSRKQLHQLFCLESDDGDPVISEYGASIPADLHQILEEEARKMGMGIEEYFQKIVIMTLRLVAEEQQVKILLENGLVSDRDQAEKLVQFARATPMQLGAMAAALAAADTGDKK